MRFKFFYPAFSVFLIVLLFSACSGERVANEPTLTWETQQDSTNTVFSTDGFAGPEAVRFDPAQDVYFVSNFNGGGNDRDSNGFISKMSAEGSIDSLRFMTGTEEFPLHAPRGMYITGDTLWAADVDGVHGFNRETGEQLIFIDFSDYETGFLNDIAANSDGNLYVTDTGTSTLFIIQEHSPTILFDSLPVPPNGITFNSETGELILAPWGGERSFPSFGEGETSLENFIQATGGGNFDGIEFVGARLIAASQNDSSLHVMFEDSDHILINVPGRPADIGIDTKRNRVAVPYIALNRVDVWQLPESQSPTP